MKIIPDTYWTELAEKFDAKLLAALNWRLKSNDPVYLTVEEIGAELDCPQQKIVALLDQLVHDGLLNAIEKRPCPNCHNHLSEEDLERLACSCGQALQEGDLPKMIKFYVRVGQRSRDVRWVITVHGMNTPGLWQQDFCWRLAKLYGYAVPVGLYKYGNIKLSPFIPYRQKHHRDSLLGYIRTLRNEMRAEKYGERPDAITHSFGTWLLAQAMLADNTSDPIKLGRVILTGSIVRPDFAWNDLLRSGRVEAVMCHYGGRDIPVRVAQYFIPNSGPSGRYGFNDQDNIIHKFEESFGHSDYFTEKNLSWVLDKRWAPFLTSAVDGLKDLGDKPNSLAASPWTPSRLRILTRTAKALLLIFLVPFLIVVAFAIPFGLLCVMYWFR